MLRHRMYLLRLDFVLFCVSVLSFCYRCKTKKNPKQMSGSRGDADAYCCRGPGVSLEGEKKYLGTLYISEEACGWLHPPQGSSGVSSVTLQLKGAIPNWTEKQGNKIVLGHKLESRWLIGTSSWPQAVVVRCACYSGWQIKGKKTKLSVLVSCWATTNFQKSISATSHRLPTFFELCWRDEHHSPKRYSLIWCFDERASNTSAQSICIC